MNVRPFLRRYFATAAVLALGATVGTMHDRGTGRVTGTARLVAFERMPDVATDYCTWETAAPDAQLSPAFAPARDRVAPALSEPVGARRVEGYQQARAGAGRAPADVRAAVAARKPLHVIHDPNAGFSTVWVDPA